MVVESASLDNVLFVCAIELDQSLNVQIQASLLVRHGHHLSHLDLNRNTKHVARVKYSPFRSYLDSLRFLMMTMNENAFSV
jgi:hypothetical protein